MTTIIGKNTTKREFKTLLRRIKAARKGVNVKKFAGKLGWKGDALKVQRAMRNER
jgi:hypothetical protein